MADVTELLARWRMGDAAALESVMPLVYAVLRRLAAQDISHERADHTLHDFAEASTVLVLHVRKR